MSKKNKVSSKQKVKKNTAKKSVKKATKPAAKKKADKTPKKVISKKKTLTKKVNKTKAPVKKAIAKKAKVVKKPVAKKPSKAVKIKKPIPKPAKVSKAKPVKKSALIQKTKHVVVKVAPVKVVKVTKPELVKSSVVKTAPKQAPEKVIKQATSVFKKAEKKTPEVMAVQNTLPVKKKDEISASKIASISHSITNPIKKPDSYSIKPEKEPAGKFEMEFVIHSSAEMLYEFLSTPSGLSEWFCDDLNIRNGIYTFIWDDQLLQARLLKTSELHLVRFQWVEKTDGSYFEFRIQKDDLTNDISLIITDFAETASERESSKLLWQSQIEKLRHVIGSIF